MNRDQKHSMMFVLGDAFLIPLAYFAAYGLRFGTIARFLTYFSPAFILMMIAGYITILYLFDLYACNRKIQGRTTAIRLFWAIGTSAVFVSLLKYVFFLFPIGRGVLFIANAILFVMLFVWRKAGFQIFCLITEPSPVLFVGWGKGVAEIVEGIQANPQEYQVVGVLAGNATLEESALGQGKILLLGAPDQLAAVLESQAVKIIVMADTTGSTVLTPEGILIARRQGVDIIDISEMYQRLYCRIPVDYIDNENILIRMKGFALANSHMAGKIKRIFDFTLAGFLFFVALPLWPLIALLIKVESKGPVFYSQRRVGKNGDPFLLHKFRSMIKDAESDEPVWARENDERVTHVGRILRRSHLDELPQLLNVIRGEMSLVGPRPERPEFVSGLQKTTPFYSLRHLVKPGLTGWAQINYPYAASMKDSKEKLEYDLYYISKMNIVLDLKILIETLSGPFSGRRRRN